MPKRVLYLSRDTGDGDAWLSRKRPKRRVTEAGGCWCSDPKCSGNQGGIAYDGDELQAFCEDGLKEAGITVPEGACVRLEINITKVK